MIGRPLDHSFNPVRRRLFVLAGVGLLLAFALDMPVHHWANGLPSNIERKDFTQLFRTGGYAPLWIGLAAAIALEDTRRSGRWSFASTRRGMMLAVAVLLAGLVAEGVKLICRRQRPDLSDGAWYAFRPLWDRPFATGGLAMPSSHAIVAFTGAFMLARYYPAARPVFLLFAFGTAASRVYVGAHYVSDVYVSMLLGWCIAAILPRPGRSLAPAEASLSHTGEFAA